MMNFQRQEINLNDNLFTPNFGQKQIIFYNVKSDRDFEYNSMINNKDLLYTA
jgi:hypothetical protein